MSMGNHTPPCLLQALLHIGELHQPLEKSQMGHQSSSVPELVSLIPNLPRKTVPKLLQKPVLSIRTSTTAKRSVTCQARVETSLEPHSRINKTSRRPILTYLESASLCAQGCSGFSRLIGPVYSLWERYRWPRWFLFHSVLWGLVPVVLGCQPEP